MPAIQRSTSRGQLVHFDFGQDAVAANQSDVELPAVGPEEGGTIDSGYTVPWSGEIVGVSFNLTAGGSAGSLSIGATIDGTEDADTTLTVTTATADYKRISRNRAQFSAGQRIGAEISTTNDWNGTSADLSVRVWALVYLEGI
jgi:hypothetical protein